MDITGLIKSKIGYDSLSFAWGLSFILADLALYYFFTLFTTLNIWAFPLIGILTFIIIGEIPRWKSYLSLLAITTLSLYIWYVGIVLALILFIVYLIYALQEKGKSNKKEGMDISEGLQIIKKNWVMFLISASRTIFFNVSYMLFPLFFIWLAFLGGAWTLKIITLTGNLSIFASVVTVLGVIFGLLQYYFSRHEEKVQQKLVTYFTNMVFPTDQFSFDKFKEFIGGDGQHSDIKNETNKLADINYQDIGQFVGRGGASKSYITLNVPTFDDGIKFGLLELKTKNKEKLIASYKAFFDKKRKEIVENLKKQNSKLNELVWFMLSNINIVEEANVAFLNINFEKEEPKTYYDFLLKTQKDILSDVFSIILQ